MTCPDRLSEIAAHERAALTDTLGRLLPPDTRVSAYLYQPVLAPGLREESPGVLWDVGPLPPDQRAVPRASLYQCAEAGRTGSFLQSVEECTRRVPQTTCIDRGAARSYRACNALESTRRSQIAVERARHGFRSRAEDGPPEGYFIHHLALAPSARSFVALATGRLPVLGTIFTVTEEEHPVDRHEYSNLVDYAIIIAGEALEIRAEYLLGLGHVGATFEGSALEVLLDDPTADAAVQLVIKLLFAHHWFFPYDPAAHLLLQQLTGNDATAALYARHGWSPPRTPRSADRSVRTLHQLVVADCSTLLSHLIWYRLGKEFRSRPGLIDECVNRALLTALILLCGAPMAVAPYGTRRSRARRDDRATYLGPSPALAEVAQGEQILAPVFAASGVRQLLRHRGNGASGSPDALQRFEPSFAVCQPGDTMGYTRTHFKPTRFVEGVDRSGVPRFSARMQDGMRERTRWLCSYAIGRLAGFAATGPGERAE